MTALTPATTVAFVTALRSEPTAKGRAGLSARRAQLTLGVLNSACAWAVDAELIARKPIAKVRRPRTETPAMTAWTVDEARRFLEFTKDDRLGFAWALLLTRGLRRIRLHDTRHTAASLMLASGTPVKVVSEMLGHASPTVTLAVYAHTMPGMAEEAGAALSASLLG